MEERLGRKEMRDECVRWIQPARDGAVVKRVMNFRVVQNSRVSNCCGAVNLSGMILHL